MTAKAGGYPAQGQACRQRRLQRPPLSGKERESDGDFKRWRAWGGVVQAGKPEFKW